MGSARRAAWLSIAVLLLGGSGCSDDTPKDTSGVLVVPFALGNRKSCEELGITGVRVELDDGAYVEEAECDAGEVRFSMVPEGRYDLVAYGLDERGVGVMDSLATGPMPVDVIGDRTTVVVQPAVTLTAAPAKLLLRWELGFGSCESARMGGFTVSAWRADGSELLMESEVACDMPGEGAQQYRLVPDVGRELSGDAVGEAQVQPFDVNDLAMGDPITYTFDSPGPGGKVKLSLSCDDGGCQGSGEAD